MQLARVPLWGMSLHRADYYGWLLCAHVGHCALITAEIDRRTRAADQFT